MSFNIWRGDLKQFIECKTPREAAEVLRSIGKVKEVNHYARLHPIK